MQTDAIRKQRFPKPTYSAKESAAVYLQAHRTIEDALIRGRRTVFDATNLEEARRRTLYEIADRCGARLLLVWMWASVGVIARRLWQRGVDRDPEDRSDADWAVYSMLARTADRPGRPFVVLNGTLSVADQIAALLTILNMKDENRSVVPLV